MIDITILAITYTISGAVSGAVQSNVTITVSGGHSATTQTGSNGSYSISGIPHGSNVTITPSRPGYSFTPSNRTIDGISSNQTNQVFMAILTDIDGNTYLTVKIGDQWWMAENLRVTRYRNGDEIPTGLSNTAWHNTTSGAYAIYPHANVAGINSDAEMVNAYGLLYNWYTVDDERGLCPVGWRVPTDEQWVKLSKLPRFYGRR